MKPRTITRITTGIATAVALIFSPLTAHAAGPAPKGEPQRELAIDMGTPFQDHAILQREMTVPVWGWSKPGAKVTVEFAGQKKSATAGKDGKWTLSLDPLKTNAKPAEMVISEQGGKTETLTDILVGEVWMASGQSNMQWLANKSSVGRELISGILKRVEEGKEKMPIIREGKISGYVVSLTPQEKGKAQWSSDWQNHSAIAFAFAYDLAKELQVPIGIVNCSFSSTQIQAWAPHEGFAAGKDEYTQEIYKRILEGNSKSPQHKAAWNAYYKELRNWAKDSAARSAKGQAAARVPSVPANLRGDRDASWLYNGKMHPMVPYAIRGAIWNQGYANQNEGIVYRNNLHSLINGWRTVWNKPNLPVYFHQFYCPKGFDDSLILKDTAEMRFGTWLAAKEIPNSGMASQIDITGGVHYYHKAVPGQRLARHALKNQYGKKIIANGPGYKGYKVQGDKLTLDLDDADGLQVGQNAPDNSSLAIPVTIPNGEKQVKLFYLADKDRAWYQANIKIKGNKIELTAPGLKAPCGVAYAGNGVGTLVSIYNKAMLPLAPFIYFENKMVTADTWPMEYMKLADKVVDPTTYGIQYEHRKLPLLSPQFRNNGVIQADVPTRIYGKALPNSVVKLLFAGTEKTITLGANESHWEVIVPAMAASNEAKTLYVTCTLDGKLVHERKITDLVTGDLWYVALQDPKMPRVKNWPTPEPPTGNLRMFTAFASKRTHPVPDRYKMSSSGNVTSRFYSRWASAEGLPKALAERIHAKTGKPVGIIIMETRSDVPLKGWVGYMWLDQVPAWKADADQLLSRYSPDPKVYANNAETYIKDWQSYWKGISTDPAFKSGALPRFPSSKSVKTPATMTYNMLIAAFGPANFKAVICLTPKCFIGDDQGATFGSEFSVMANCWKETFASGKKDADTHFIYAMPGKELAPKATKPAAIKGKTTAYEMNEWLAPGYDDKTRQSVVGDGLVKFLEAAVNAVYK